MIRIRHLPTALPLAAALLAVPAAAGAQAGRALSGRWRVVIEGLGPGPVLGDLRLTDRGGTCQGTIALSLVDRPPAPLEGCARDEEGMLVFRAVADAPLAFAARRAGARLTGTVARDGDPPARFTAEPLSERMEFYPSPPRFTLRQLTGGTYTDAHLIAGPLVAAAREGDWRGALERDYAGAAERGGRAVLPGERLVTEGPRRVRALAERAATLAAAQRALEEIRGRLAPADRPAFDRVFRGARGTWRLELHGAAFEAMRVRLPGLTWGTLLEALHAPQPAGLSAEDAAVRAIEALRASGDSGAIAALLAEARRTSTRDARVLAALVEGYRAAEAWHREALATLLVLPWVPRSGTRVSPAQLVRDGWIAASPGEARLADSLPAIRTQRFADPQAVPRYGVPGPLAARLVRVDNWSASAWLERHGHAGMLEVLHRLEWPALAGVSLAEGREAIRLVSVPARARETLNGFLEPRDAIAVDPAWVPVLALGSVVHEWVHLLFEGRRVARLAARLPASPGALELPPADPWFAEGLAEAWTAELLAPAVAAVPLLGVSEPEKRARLARTAPDDPHVLGYLVVRRALAVDGASVARLLDAGSLDALARDPAFAPAWAPFRGAPDLLLPNPSRRFLVPETTFTVHDLVPDPVRATIRSVD